jgi:alpha-amylase
MNELRKAGFTAVWIPNSVKGASGGYSMGYDPFDHYDLGSKLQGASGKPAERPTHWGELYQLRRMVAFARANGIDVYHDMVLNHLNGDPGNKVFQYVNWNGVAGKGRFPKQATDFHDKDSDLDDTSFGPDLNYYNGYTYDSTMQWGDWLVKSLDLQGFRFDYVKGLPYKTDVSPRFWFQNQFLNYGAMAGKFSVSEYADDNRDTLNWFVAETGHKSSAFDFTLRAQLKALCDGNGLYDLRGLRWAGLVHINPAGAVTWVETTTPIPTTAARSAPRSSTTRSWVMPTS